MLTGSANIVGDAFALVSTPYRRKCCHPIEQLRDVGARARWRAHRARPTVEHDQIEVDRTELVAKEQGAVGLEMIFDDIEESGGAGFGPSYDHHCRGVIASQAARILPCHQLFLQRVRQKNEPLIKLRALGG